MPEATCGTANYFSITIFTKENQMSHLKPSCLLVFFKLNSFCCRFVLIYCINTSPVIVTSWTRTECVCLVAKRYLWQRTNWTRSLTDADCSISLFLIGIKFRFAQKNGHTGLFRFYACWGLCRRVLTEDEPSFQQIVLFLPLNYVLMYFTVNKILSHRTNCCKCPSLSVW